MRILIVEDDRQIAENLYDYLEGSGHECDYAHTLVEGRRLLAGNGWDALLLDLNLPDGDGLQLLHELRARGDDLPVLVLTARDTLTDKEAGFSGGADDYLVKPFALQEVALRLTALHRRRRAAAPACQTFGPLAYWPATDHLQIGAAVLDLPPKARRLLTVMLAAPEQLHRREVLERAVWGEVQPTSDNLRTLLHGLRRQLTPHGVLIVTVHGLGYRLALA